MAAKKYVQSQTLYLAGSGVLAAATSIVLTSLTDIYGNAITSITAFGDKGYITLEPDTSNEEAATFTSVTANANGTVTLGGVSTVLAQSPYTETSGLVRAHSGGTKVVITDNVAFWAGFTNRNNDEALVGRWTTPVVPSAANDLTNKSYVDGVAVAGAPNASPTVKGIVQEATQAQVLAKTAAGSTGAELYVNPSTLSATLLSDYKADTGSANAYAIAPSPAITAYTSGQIFSFKATNANTTASTLNVNALGTKTIKKVTGADLVANDIIAGQIVVVEYDGTNFQMLNDSGNSNTYLPTQTGNSGNYLTTDGTTPSWGSLKKAYLLTSFTTTVTAPANDNTLTTVMTSNISTTNAANGDVFHLKAYYEFTTSNNGGSTTIYLYLGATQIAAVSVSQGDTTIRSYGGYIEAYVYIVSSSSQQGDVMRTVTSSAATTIVSISRGTATEDITSAKALALKVQHSSATVSIGPTTVYHGFIERITG